MDIDRSDAILMEILQEKKSVVGFLDAMFGFLSRRTDFYHEMRNENDTIGFPSGVKEQLVFNALKHYEKRMTEKGLEMFTTTPLVAQEMEIETSSGKEEESSVGNVKEECRKKESNEEKSISLPIEKNKTEKVLTFRPNEYYNGANYDFYCWSQTISDIEIHVRLPNDVTSSKQIQLKIDPENIKIRNKISNSIILEGKLSSKCKSNDAVWSISGGKLQITLDKIKEVWWNKFLDTEPALDLSKLDCSRPYEELTEESQATIDKLRWDQHNKLLGLPTMEDIKNRELLRTAWNAEGSPFKGQPFDPSIVKFN